MPIDFVKMQREAGFYARLVTLFTNTLNFEEDLSLGLRSRTGRLARKWRDSKIPEPEAIPSLKFYRPKNSIEDLYFTLRDLKNQSKISAFINEHGLYDFDVYHFDGGMDFYRNLRFAKELKRRGKKIICCYFGSDLRTRGVFRELDEMSNLNLTVEFDHLKIHSNIHYLFFPFDERQFQPRVNNNPVVKIVHSPTNRVFKGTDKILKVIDEVKQEREIEFLLLENMNRNEVLKIKAGCDLAIDQVGGESGGSGYGKNSLETMSMGLPTFTEFSPDYLGFLGDNPFIQSTIKTLKSNLIKYIDDAELRAERSAAGIKWIKRTHSFKAVNERLMELYTKYNII
jgi:glycosyltransferase involved in cell wall biosynthesis